MILTTTPCRRTSESFLHYTKVVLVGFWIKGKTSSCLCFFHARGCFQIGYLLACCTAGINQGRIAEAFSSPLTSWNVVFRFKGNAGFCPFSSAGRRDFITVCKARAKRICLPTAIMPGSFGYRGYVAGLAPIRVLDAGQS